MASTRWLPSERSQCSVPDARRFLSLCCSMLQRQSSRLAATLGCSILVLVRRSRERGSPRLPDLDLGLTSRVQADHGGPHAHHRQARCRRGRPERHAALLRAGGFDRACRKSPAGYRLYDQDSARRLRFIKQAQHCGFTLAEIRELHVLRARDAARCGDVRKRAIEKKRQLEGKVRSMRAMCKALDRLIAGCVDETRPVEGCAILAAFEQPETTARTN